MHSPIVFTKFPIRFGLLLVLLGTVFISTVAPAQSVLQTESFESTIFPAPGWRHARGTLNVLSGWSRQAQATASFPFPGVLSGGGSHMMMLNSDVSGSPSNPDVALMITKPFDFSNNAGVNPEFKFWMFRDNISTVNTDLVKVYVNTIPTISGATLLTNTSGASQISRYHNSFPAVTANTWQEITYSLPAATYNQKKYYFIIEGICTGGANIYLDLFTTNTFPAASNVADVSFDMFTQNAITVSPGTTNNMIVGIRCIMGGTSGNGVVNGASSTAVKLDSLLLNTTGTTNVNDIQNAKIWYTGGSKLFSTGYISPFPATVGSDDYPTAQYGTTIVTSISTTNLDFTNAGTSCFYLEYDTTYFWLTYDIKPTGVGGNNLDSDFRGASIGGAPGQCPSPINSSTPKIPGVFTINGSSQIGLPYCQPTYSEGTAWANYTNNDYVQSVVLVGVPPTSINTNFGASNNNAGLPTGLGCYPNCDFTAHPPDYELWPAVAGRTVVLIQGSIYSITVQAGTWYSSNYIQAWIDYNNNGLFEAAEALSPTPLPNLAANATATYNFTVPGTSFVGPTRLRVREVYANSNPDPCLNYTYGETEDFTIIISPNCPAAYKLWLGNNRNWHDPVNWCGGVPTSMDSVVISKAQVSGATGRRYFPPTILSQSNSANQANAKSLWISADDSLIIDAPTPASPALKVATNVINNGRIEVLGTLGSASSAVTISNGTLANALYSPFRSNASDSRMQIIYTAAELAAQGLIAGDQITSIRCSLITKNSTAPFAGFTIGYALLPAATTQHTSNVPQSAALTTVFGPTAYTTGLGLNTFTLTAPIVWDGTSNLLVQFCYDNAAKNGTAADAIYFTQTDGGGRKSVLLLTTSVDNSGSGCSLQPGTGIIDNLFNSYGSYRPNFTFVLNRVYGKPQITVQKDWINNGSFVPANSRVLMDSTVNQVLGGSQPSTFHELQISKGAAAQNVTMQRAVTVQDTLLLNQGCLIMNGNTLSITNPAPSTGSHTNFVAINGPITRTNGFIISESPGSFSSTSTTVGSYVKWTVGTTTGWRVIPFGDNASTPIAIPFTFLHNSGDLGTFSVATYRAAGNNPFPPTVTNLNIFSSTTNNAANVVDRFWVTEKTGSNPNTSFSLRWSDAENSGASALNPPRVQPWRLVSGSSFYEYWLRISNTSPAAPSGSTLATSVSYTQTTPYIAAGVADSVRVLNWDWPVIPAISSPFNIPSSSIGNFVPWAISNNNAPLGAVVQGNVLAASLFNKTDIACSTIPNGAIDISVSGGVAPYSYLWSNGSTTQDIAGLAAGNYSVTVTDAAGATSSLSISLVNTLVSPTGNPVLSGPDAFCFSNNTPYSLIGVTNANNYQWSWNTTNAIISSGQGTSVVNCNFTSAFTSGQLCVTALNQTCSIPPVCKTVSASLAGQSLLAEIDSVTCSQSADGSVEIVSNDSIIIARNPGLLISEIHTDPAGNDSPFEWVELFATANINFNQTPYTVVFSNNGTATTKGWMQGGTPSPTPNNSTYAFLIDTGSVVAGEVVYVGGSSMTPAGKKLRVKNTATQAGDGGIGGAFLSSGVLGNGGGVADGVAIFRNSIALMDSNSVPVDAVFFGTSIGVAALTDTSKGFTLPTNDLYSGGRLKTGSYLAPEPLGSYSLVANGAFNRANATFSTPRTFTTNTTTWSGALTGISLVDNQYVWSTGSTGSLITGLSAGTYSVTITPPGGSGGCTSQIIIPSPQPIVVSVTSPEIACFGDSVNVQISASGGSPPYSGIGTFRLPSGSYLFTVTDVNGCTGAAALSLPQPNLLQVQASAAPILCDGGNTTVYLNAIGGVAPYTGLGPFIKTQGTYSFTITDAKGCSAQTSLSLVAPPPLVAETVPGIINCGGDSTTVFVSASGGVAPYTGTGLFSVFAGSYSFLVSDSNGCTAIGSGFVAQPTPLLVTANGGSLSCNVGGAVPVSSSVSGGIQPYQFLWSTGSTSSVANATGSSIGLYTVTVTDAQGCIASDTAAVLLNTQSLSLNLSAPSNRICPNDSSASITSFVTGGEPPVQYLWSNGNQQANLSGLPPGVYTCSVTDAFGCTATSSFSIMPFITPVIQSVLPPATNAGLPLVIVGQHLGLVDTVRFTNASTTTFSVSGDSVINLLVPSNAGSGPLTLIDSNGCSTNAGSFSYLSQFAELTLKLYIEGLYAGSGFMNVPLVNSGYASDAISVDTIEVLLHPVSSPSTIAERRKTVLRANGSTECTFPGYCIGNSYWVSIRHRNSVETWSKQPVYFLQQSSYNFGGNAQPPTVVTTFPSNVLNTSVLLGGTVLADGGDPILLRGLCWGTNPNPILSSDSKTQQGNTVGTFSTQLTGLLPNTTYYLRAYAINSVGISYGNEVQVTTLNVPSSQIMDIDGNIYDTVIIGQQVWLKQNLRTTRYRNGSIIPQISDSLQWINTNPSQTGAWCYYRNDSIFNGYYGKLYNWYAINDTAICPIGWRVPTDSDWNRLAKFLYSASDTSCFTCSQFINTTDGGRLKSTGNLFWNFPNVAATNSTRFSALPGGCRRGNLGPYLYVGFGTYWWSSSQFNTLKGISRGLENNSGAFYRYPSGKQDGFSVRCIKD